MGRDRENETASDTENVIPFAMRETGLVRRLRAARPRPTPVRIQAPEMFSGNPGLQDAEFVFLGLIGQGAPVLGDDLPFSSRERRACQSDICGQVPSKMRFRLPSQ